MNYRFLGRTGLKVSELSFGSWVTFGAQVDEAVAEDCLVAAREHGVNFFDNAETYAGGRSEEVMGKILKKKKWKRSDLVVSTKIFWGGTGPNDRGLSRKHIVEGTRAALDRLQLEYVDLIFCHRPDRSTPLEETVRAMNHVLDRGWAFYWGTSEWSGREIAEACRLARELGLVPPAMEQPQYNMFHRERVEKEYATLYRDFGLGTTIWSPLASGLLTGKYNDGMPAGTRVTMKGYEWLKAMFENEEGREQLEKCRALAPIARDLDCTMAQMALAWCLKNPHVSTVITGASRPQQVHENMKALDVVHRLDTGAMARIEAVLANAPEPDEDFRG